MIQYVKILWEWVDSNHRNPKVTDLQSVAINRYATLPNYQTQNLYATGLNSLIANLRNFFHLQLSLVSKSSTVRIVLPKLLRWPHLITIKLFVKLADFTYREAVICPTYTHIHYIYVRLLDTRT